METREAAPPGSPLHAGVVHAWTELFGVAPASADEDFFAAGGHSLMAMRLLARLHREHGHAPEFEEFLAAPTPEALTAFLSRLPAVPSAVPSGTPAPEAPPRPGLLPPGPALARLRTLHDLGALPAVYNEAFVWRVTGPLDLTRLARAWDDVVARHEVLRARFVDTLEGPFLEVAAIPPCVIPPTDAGLVQEAYRDAEAARFTTGQSLVPFDLRVSPLWRWRCLRFEDEDHALVLVLHHALMDDWSMRLLVQDLSDRYASDGPPGRAWTEGAGRHTDLVRWQEERRQGARGEELRAFWRARFRAVPTPVTLPHDHPRPAVASGRGTTVAVTIPAAVRRRLEQLGRDEAASPFVVGLAAYGVVLHALGGDTGPTVCTPVAVRGKELTGLVGFVLNTVPVRLDVVPGATFRELVRRTRAAAMPALANSALPFDDIVSLAEDARVDWMNTAFVVVDEPPPRPRLGDAVARPVPFSPETAKFELLVLLQPDDRGGWRMEVEVSADRFDGSTASSLAAWMRRVFESLAASPDATPAIPRWEKSPQTPAPASIATVPAPAPAPAQPAKARGPSGVPPRNETERLIASVWAEFLRGKRFGVHDGFQELGGHSLMAMRVANRFGRLFGRPVTVRDLRDHPTIADLAVFFGTPEPTAAPGPSPARPAPGAVDRGIPSFSQQRLLFLEEYAPTPGLYNSPVVLRLRGPLEVARLRAALGELVRRHESLRSVFRNVDGELRVEVTVPGEIAFEVTDLGHLDAGRREEAARRLLSAEVRAPFDLAAAPPVRFRLVRAAEDDHWLASTFHHVVTDGWSSNVFLRELAAVHDALAQGRPSPLAPLRMQFPDHAAQQRQRLSGDLLRAQLDYWRQHLAGAPPRLDLPLDRPRPAAPSHRGAMFEAWLPAEVGAGLDRIAQAVGGTRFMPLLASFQLLLHRHSGQDDVVVGTPVAGRLHPDSEGVVGYFANTLAIRTSFAGNPTLSRVLARTRADVIGALDHQDLPFERLVTELGVPRDPAHSPVFQCFFAYHEEPAEPVPFGGLRVERVDVGTGTSRFDLAVDVERAGDRMRTVIRYATDLFDEATVRRMAQQWETLLRGIIASPDRPVQDYELLDAEQVRELACEWSGSSMPVDAAATVHGLFAAAAARNPDAVAVSGVGRSLTYRELDAQSDRLARHLRALGVGPDDRVGVCVERSPSLVVALLGVLKAGGAYVPLDPGYPADRLEFMLADSGAKVLVTGAEDWDGPRPEGTRLLRLTDLPGDPGGAEGAPGAGATAANLAYVIYTSGSTGRPKGVEVEHRNVAAFLQWVLAHYGDGQLSGVLFGTSVCFDISVLEVFGTLAAGGQVVVVESPLDVARLPSALAEGITLVNTVPSVFREMLRLGCVPRAARTLVLGGEKVPQEVVDAAHATGHLRRVVDQYGPTETAVYSLFAERMAGGRPTIGRPIANTRVYVVDKALRLLPVGVPGELLIGGAGVARGYHGRPDLTAERFIPDPFRPGTGDRVYRTGDLVRWRADRTLEFLGRNDTQLKVRGFRIEPGEIETALRRHPQVAAAAVVARELTPGEPVLVAYIVPRIGTGPGHAELRAHLSASLPDYMVPRVVVPLGRLPLTPNGKVNLAALPAPRVAPAGTGPHTPSLSPTEAVLAGIWRELLPHAHPDPSSNFFGLGGHSLMAMRMVARVEAALGVRLPIRTVFSHPGLGELAAAVDALRRPGPTAPPPAQAPGDRETGEI